MLIYITLILNAVVKKEPQANNMLRSESYYKSCKDNKSQDNNNNNDEIKRNINPYSLQ